MLEMNSVSTSYGQVPMLRDVSLRVGPGEMVCLLGPNGAGKSTTFNAICGLLRSDKGSIRIAGKDVKESGTERLASLGAGFVPEGRRLFPTLTVRENLVATAGNRLNRKEPWTLERVYTLFPRLRERANQAANTLSGGEQQMMVVGRALMTNPRLLILDEATEGLAPVIRAEIWACIEVLKKEGQSILLIDKNLQVLKRLADRHYIIEKGKTVWSGSGEDMNRDADLVHGYVGI